MCISGNKGIKGVCDDKEEKWFLYSKFILIE